MLFYSFFTHFMRRRMKGMEECSTMGSHRTLTCHNWDLHEEEKHCTNSTIFRSGLSIETFSQPWKLFRRRIKCKTTNLLTGYLGCTLRNVANVNQNKLNITKFFPFLDSNKDLPKEIWEDKVAWLPTVLTGQAHADLSFILASAKIFTSIVAFGLPTLPTFDTVNLCSQFFLQVTGSRQNSKTSSLSRTTIRSCKADAFFNLNESDQVEIEILYIAGF